MPPKEWFAFVYCWYWYFRAARATAETLCLVVDPRLQESPDVVPILFLQGTESSAASADIHIS